jgi:hypothetical protein
MKIRELGLTHSTDGHILGSGASAPFSFGARAFSLGGPQHGLGLFSSEDFCLGRRFLLHAPE